MDTPGMYSLSAITEEERVACRFLMDEESHVVAHVIDAKNIDRMLGLTLQLIETGLPVVVVLNMADEARALGVRIDTDRLQERLGVPVVETVATTAEGVGELALGIEEAAKAAATAESRPVRIDYGPALEEAVARLEGLLP